MNGKGGQRGREKKIAKMKANAIATTNCFAHENVKGCQGRDKLNTPGSS